MKRSNREVNIFNMSLLDILCGALGAFCFMMLSLLPYYRPRAIEVSREQKELLDELQKIKDLSERLKSASTAEDLTELVEQLKKQIAALEARIKQLQGQVNALSAENEDLKARVAKLEDEARRLRSRNQQLELENQQLQQEKQRLLARNEMLEKENQQLQQQKQQLEQEKRKLESRLQQQIPWTVTVTVNPPNPRASLDCSLHETALSAEDDKTRQPDFDPALPVQPVVWAGDTRLAAPGSVTRVNAARMIGSEMKFYARVNYTGGFAVPLTMHTSVTGNSLAPVSVLPASVTPERSWVYAGTFRVESPNRITFTEATPAERDAEWERLTKTRAPAADAVLTDAEMGSGFEKRRTDYERQAGANTPQPVKKALLEIWLLEAQSEKERSYVKSLQARLFGGPGTAPPSSDDARQRAEAARRRSEYLRMFNEAKDTDTKNTILRRWLADATSEAERNNIQQMMRQLNGLPAPTPKPDSPLLRGIDELKTKPQTPP